MGNEYQCGECGWEFDLAHPEVGRFTKLIDLSSMTPEDAAANRAARARVSLTNEIDAALPLTGLRIVPASALPSFEPGPLGPADNYLLMRFENGLVNIHREGGTMFKMISERKDGVWDLYLTGGGSIVPVPHGEEFEGAAVGSYVSLWITAPPAPATR